MRINTHTKGERARITTVLLVCLLALLVTGSAGAVSFCDYFPTRPSTHGIKTFEWTWGGTGQYTSRIEGSEAVPYSSGPITGVYVTNYWFAMKLLACNDGTTVKWLADEDSYLSTDTSLTAHPPGWSFGTLTDGELIDAGVYYALAKNLATWQRVDNSMILVDIQDVNTPNGQYQNAVIFWYLDTDSAFAALDFHGRDADLGIVLPDSADANGYAVTGLEIFGSGTGLVASGNISSGSLGILAELTQIAPVPSLAAVYPVVNPATGHIMMALGYDDGTLEFRDWQGNLLQVRYGFGEVTALSAYRYGTSPLPRLFVGSTDSGGALRVIDPANINNDIAGRFGFGRITALEAWGENDVLVASSDSGGTLRRLSKTDLSDLAARFGFTEITATGYGWDTTNGEYRLVASTDSGGVLRCLDSDTLADTGPAPRYGWRRIYALSSNDTDGDGNAEIVVGSSDSGGAIRFIELPNLATDLAGRYGFGTVYEIAYGLLGVAQEQGNDKASIAVASSDGGGAFRVIEVTRSTLATTMADAAARWGFGACVGMGLDEMLYQTGVNVLGTGTTDGGRCAAHIMDENLTDLTNFSVP